MNAFEAAKKNGKDLKLQNELETMFVSQNKSLGKNTTDITVTFLQVDVHSESNKNVN